MTGVTPWEDPLPIADAPKDRPVLAWCEWTEGWIVASWNGLCWHDPTEGRQLNPTVFYELPPERPGT